MVSTRRAQQHELDGRQAATHARPQIPPLRRRNAHDHWRCAACSRPARGHGRTRIAATSCGSLAGPMHGHRMSCRAIRTPWQPHSRQAQFAAFVCRVNESHRVAPREPPRTPDPSRSPRHCTCDCAMRSAILACAATLAGRHRPTRSACRTANHPTSSAYSIVIGDVAMERCAHRSRTDLRAEQSVEHEQRLAASAIWSRRRRGVWIRLANHVAASGRTAEGADETR